MLFSETPYFWRDRLIGCAVHLGLSLCIAALAALLVFGIWYPYPYREISGGRELFVLLVTVDVLLGPLVTLAVFNRQKPRSELLRDLAVTGLLQMGALTYGLWTVFVARPVHMVFEIDRFRVVQAIDVDASLLRYSPQSVKALPFWGPTLLAVRPFKNDKERIEMTLAALQGVALSSRPELWRPYEDATKDVLKAAMPATQLLSRFTVQATEIELALSKIDRKPGNVVYLPLVGRKSYWTAFLDPVTAQILTTMPLDSF
jgi:hypothetical protein